MSCLVFDVFSLLSLIMLYSIAELKHTNCLTSLLANLSESFSVNYTTYNDLNSSILIQNTTSCDKDLKLPSAEYFE